MKCNVYVSRRMYPTDEKKTKFYYGKGSVLWDKILWTTDKKEAKVFHDHLVGGRVADRFSGWVEDAEE